MLAILAGDAYNDTYGRKRMYQALLLRQPDGVHMEQPPRDTPQEDTAPDTVS